MAEAQHTLLLVEDEALVAMVEKRQLRNAGYEVIHSATGEQAVAMCCAEDSPVDLVLMDIDLGDGIDGTEAARRILVRRELPVVFLSSHTEKEVVEKTEEITSYGYIVKNSGEVVLLASLKMAFRLFDAKREVNQQKMQTETANEQLRVTNEELQVSQSRLLGRERALGASELRFRSMVEGAPEPIFIQTDQTFAYLNPAALAMFGAESEAQLVGGPVLERVHPDWHETGRQRMRRLNDAQEAVRNPVEQKWLRLDGEEIWVETVGEPIEYEGRNGALVFVREVTERRRHRKAIGAWHDLMEYVIRHHPNAVAVLDRNLHFRYVSDRFVEDYGVSGEEVIGRHHYEVFPEIPERRREVHRRALNGEVLSSELDSFPRDDGTLDYTRWECRPWYEADGQVGGIILYTEVITERENVRALQQENELFLHNVLDAVQDGISVLNPDLTIRHVNRAMELWYQDAHPLVGKRCYEAYHRNLSEPCADCPTLRSLQSGNVESLEVPGLPGSKIEWLEVYAYPMRAPETGEITAVIEFVRDVTEDRRSREALQRAVEENETLMRELHHRVKNNLNVVSGLLAMEIDRLSDEQSRRVFADAQLRIQAMSTIYDMLHRTSTATHLDLGEYLETVAQAVFRTYRSPSKQVELVTDIASVTSDARKAVPIGLILNELISNALKYAYPNGSDTSDANPTGGAPSAPGAPGDEQVITVELTRAGAKTVLAVEDRGVGLPPEFELERVESTGLTLVKTLAEQLGADLQVYGYDGTRVDVTFSA